MGDSQERRMRNGVVVLPSVIVVTGVFCFCFLVVGEITQGSIFIYSRSPLFKVQPVLAKHVQFSVGEITQERRIYVILSFSPL